MFTHRPYILFVCFFVLLLGLTSCNKDDETTVVTPQLSTPQEAWGLQEPLIVSPDDERSAITQYSKDKHLKLTTADILVFEEVKNQPEKYSKVELEISAICIKGDNKFTHVTRHGLTEKVPLIGLVPRELLFHPQGEDLQNSTCDVEITAHHENTSKHIMRIRSTPLFTAKSDVGNKILLKKQSQLLLTTTNATPKLYESRTSQYSILPANQTPIDQLELRCEHFTSTLPHIYDSQVGLNHFDLINIQKNTNRFIDPLRGPGKQLCRVFSLSRGQVTALSDYFHFISIPRQLIIDQMNLPIPRLAHREPIKVNLVQISVSNPNPDPVRITVPKNIPNGLEVIHYNLWKKNRNSTSIGLSQNKGSSLSDSSAQVLVIPGNGESSFTYGVNLGIKEHKCFSKKPTIRMGPSFDNLGATSYWLVARPHGQKISQTSIDGTQTLATNELPFSGTFSLRRDYPSLNGHPTPSLETVRSYPVHTNCKLE